MMGNFLAKVFEFFNGQIAKVFSYFDIRASAKVASRIAYIGTVFAAFIGLQATITGLAASVYLSINDPWIETAFYILIPDNAVDCLAAYVTAHIAYAGFQWLKWAAYKPFQ